MSSGHIRNVYQPNEIDVLLQLFYQITVGSLFVVEVVQHPHLRAIDSANNLECFANRGQIHIRIFQGIDRFDHDLHLVCCGKVSSTLKVLDRCRVLNASRHAVYTIARF